MGWLYIAGISRRELITDNTTTWERTKEDGALIKSTCLAHCYRGGVFSGVLWSVWERSFIKDGQPVEQPQRWIVCNLLRYEGGEWCYKEIDESMHPYFYSCPLSYLNLVPIEQLGGNAQWRSLVNQFHARSIEKRRAKEAARCG